jgi:hypothetical protein
MKPSNQDQLPMQPATAHLPIVHLTDAQFTELLLGTIPPSVIAHLETCPQCAEEAQRVSGAIGSFAQQSRLWAEHRAASRSAQRPARQTPLSWLGIPVAPIAWVVATLTLAVGLGIARRAEHSVPPSQPIAAVQPAPAVTPAAVTSATLKADNALLSTINGELSADAAPSASAYGLTVSHHPARSQPAAGISN